MAHLASRLLIASVVALAAGCSEEGKPSPGLEVTPKAITRTAVGSPGSNFLTALVRPHTLIQLYADATFDHPAIASLSFTSAASDEATFQILFKDYADLEHGPHTGTVTIHVCYDPLCEREIRGSPQTVQVSVTVRGVDLPAEAGVETLPITGQQPLAHDVVDAEYSNALDAIVMVSASPGPALHLYDPATGSEQSLALDWAPTAVSVAPDGLTAAVGHNGKITVVDLANLDDPLPGPTLLDVSVAVTDVVVGGNGYVYALGNESPHRIRAVQIATNAETLNTGDETDARYAKLHPSGTKIYGSHFYDVARFDLGAGTPAYAYDSPYTTEYPIRDGLWLSEDGARIFTSHGHVFKASDDPAQDLTHAGELAPLLAPGELSPKILALSDSTERGEIALIEDVGSFSHLAFYDAGDFGEAERYSIAPFESAYVDHVQHGRFIFHSADGSTRYLITRLSEYTGSRDLDEEEYQVGEVTVDGVPP